MGIYTTLEITKEDALNLIECNIRGSDNDKISDVLFALFGDKYIYNYKIVDDYSSDWSYKYNGFDFQF